MEEGELQDRLPKINTNILSNSIVDAVKNIPRDILDMDEEKLQKKINPTLTLFSLKDKFWEEISNATFYMRNMSSKNVFDGVCSSHHFYKILKDPYKAAFLLSPLRTYESTVRASLQSASARYEELINIDINITKQVLNKETKEWEEKTDVCPKKAALLLNVIKNLEDRVRGQAVQNILTHNTNGKKEEKSADVVDVATLDQKIKELELKLQPELEGDYVTEENESEEIEEVDGSDEHEDRGNQDRPKEDSEL